MAVAADTPYAKGDTWQATMLAARERLLGAGIQDRPAVVTSLWERLEQDFPIPSDWMLQDLGRARNAWFAPEADRELEKKLIAAVVKELGDPAELVQKLAALVAENPPRKDRRWLDLYVQACEQRRAKRLVTVLQAAPKLVFTKHYNLARSHYAYTEAQSDAQAERNYRQVLDDGRIVYTRWEYNDRGQIYPQPLFQMNPDGTIGQPFFFLAQAAP